MATLREVSLSPTLRQVAAQAPQTMGVQDDDPWYLEMLNPDKSALGSFLQFIDRPGQVVRNVIRGEFGSAGRQAVDFLGDAVDAFLPGDLIGNLSTQRDYVSGSDLVGMQDSHWAPRLLADIGIGVVTDPLSLLSFGGAGAANAVARAAGKQAANVGKSVARSSAQAVKESSDAATDLLRLAGRGASTDDSLKASYLDRLTPAVQRKSALEAELKAIDDAAKELDGMVDAPTRIKKRELEKSLREASHSVAKDVEAFKARYVDEKFASPSASAEVRDVVPSTLEMVLEPGARRALAKQGDQAIPSFIRKVADEIGDNTSPDHIKSVMSKYPDAFEQGGVRLLRVLGGKRIKAFDNVYDVARNTFGKAFESLPANVKGSFDKAGSFAQKMGRGISKTMGSNWVKAAPKYKDIYRQAVTHGAATTEANMVKALDAMKGTLGSKETEDAIGYVLDNVADLRKYGKPAVELADTSHLDSIGIEDIMGRIGELRRVLPEEVASKVDWDELTNVVPRIAEINEDILKLEASYGIHGGRLAELGNALEEGMTRDMFIYGDDIAEAGAKLPMRPNASYLYRKYQGKVRNADGTTLRVFGDADDSISGQVFGPSSSASPVKGRTIKHDDSLVRYLNDNPELSLDSTFNRITERINKHGQLVTRAVVARELLGPAYETLGKAATPIATLVTNMAEVDPAFADFLQAITTTIKPRGTTFSVLAKTNKVFKPAAVYQLFLPRVAAISRNLIGGAWGAGSTIGYDEALKQIKMLPGTFISTFPEYLKQVKRGLYGKANQVDAAGIHAAAIAQTAKKSPIWGGKLADDIRFVNSLETLPLDERLARAKQRSPFLAEAIESGVLDGFVRSEQLMKNHLRGRAAQGVADVAMAPAAMFQHAEGVMRYATYKSLREQGLSQRAAQAMQNDAFIDYSVLFSENRTLRDLVPFAAFVTGTIAQQSKMLARRPAVGVAMAQLYGQNTEYPLMPWMQDTPSFHYGDGENDEKRVAAGLGLPFEALGMIPNLSAGPREALGGAFKSIVGSAHPLLKSGIGYATGQDPFFGGAYGAYDKTPESLQALGLPERGEAARLYRELANTGMIQPLVGVMQTFDRLLDPRLTESDKAINLLTGMRIVANDPDKAAFRILQDRLAGDPRAKQFIRYQGGSEEIDGAIEALREAGKRMKEKRKAQEAAKLRE